MMYHQQTGMETFCLILKKIGLVLYDLSVSTIIMEVIIVLALVILLLYAKWRDTK